MFIINGQLKRMYIISPENFCYWLQGWFELNQTIDHREGVTPETVQMIKEHLKLVFDKLTPSVGRDVMSKGQKIELDKATSEKTDNDAAIQRFFDSIKKDPIGRVHPQWPTVQPFLDYPAPAEPNPFVLQC